MLLNFTAKLLYSLKFSHRVIQFFRNHSMPRDFNIYILIDFCGRLASAAARISTPRFAVSENCVWGLSCQNDWICHISKFSKRMFFKASSLSIISFEKYVVTNFQTVLRLCKKLFNISTNCKLNVITFFLIIFLFQEKLV